MTLIELVVYFGISALLLALVAAFFKVSRRQYESASSSYLIGQEASQAVAWIKRDLQETALSSIRIDNEGGNPALSFISASEENKARSFNVSRFGTPAWDRHTYYTITEDGELYRWDRPLAEPTSPKRFLPVANTANMRNREGANNQKVMLREVMLPNQQIKMDGADAPFPTIDSWGGFKVGFVVYDSEGEEHLVSENPSQISQDLAESPGSSVVSLEGETLDITDLTLTKLVHVRLGLKLKGFRDNAPNAVLVPVRVSPMH